MSTIDTAEYRRLALIAAGVDPSQIPPVLDTATWRRLMLGALAQIGEDTGDASALTTGTLADARLSGNVPLKDTANIFAQNQTLNGTNNIAPNQVAESNGSIITRQLLWDALEQEPSSDLVTHASTTQVGVGAFGGTNNTLGTTAQITTTNASYASAWLGESFGSHRNFGGAALLTNKDGDFIMKGAMLRVEQNQNWILRILVGQGNPTRVAPLVGSDALSSRGWGVEFYYDGTDYVYRPFWHNGTFNTGATGLIPNISHAGTNFWVERVYMIRMRHTAAGNIAFFISDGMGGRLPTTPTFTTDVAWGAGSFGGRFWGIEVAAASSAAPTQGSRISCRTSYLTATP